MLGGRPRLFSEIYLDRYFRDPESLLAALNAQVAVYNADKPEADQIAAFSKPQRLGRNSTGSPSGWPPAAAKRC